MHKRYDVDFTRLGCMMVGFYLVLTIIGLAASASFIVGVAWLIKKVVL